jgi:AbrB family looped-hinge helix DNA binding protein
MGVQWYLVAMADTITMDGAGRIVLPKALRDRMRLRGGAKLRIAIVGDHLELIPAEVETGPPLIRKGGLLVVAAGGRPCDAVEALRADREEREGGLSGEGRA